MTVRDARRLAACLTLVLAMTSGLSRARSLQVAPSPNEIAGRPIVYSAVVDGIIHPVSAEYMMDTLERADLAGAVLVVFTLRTPGGLLDSTRAIVSSMIASKAPVAIFVSPSGARAASAGFILTIAADVAAMSPGTHIGAAHPVEGGGPKMDEIMSKKATEDSAAYARTLATRRHRNVELAAQAVTESRAFTEGEAAAAVPPLDRRGGAGRSRPAAAARRPHRHAFRRHHGGVEDARRADHPDRDEPATAYLERGSRTRTSRTFSSAWARWP